MTSPVSTGDLFRALFDPVGAAKEKLEKLAAASALADVIVSGFSEADLNPGQEQIAFVYVADAMISAANECLANEDPDPELIIDSGFNAHYAAEQSLSELITEIAYECVDVIEQAIEESAESNV